MCLCADYTESNSYARLYIGVSKNQDEGELASPWLNPKPGYSCQLKFQYFMESSDGCKLSLFRETAEGDRTNVWETTESTGPSFSNLIPVDIHCSQGRYRVCILNLWLILSLSRLIKVRFQIGGPVAVWYRCGSGVVAMRHERGKGANVAHR